MNPLEGTGNLSHGICFRKLVFRTENALSKDISSKLDNLIKNYH